MAAAGRINVKAPDRQLVYAAKAARWFRVTNAGSTLMGVTFTDEDGVAGRSAQIGANSSKDFVASRLEIRDDSGSNVVGSYEAV